MIKVIKISQIFSFFYLISLSICTHIIKHSVTTVSGGGGGAEQGFSTDAPANSLTEGKTGTVSVFPVSTSTGWYPDHVSKSWGSSQISMRATPAALRTAQRVDIFFKS